MQVQLNGAQFGWKISKLIVGSQSWKRERAFFDKGIIDSPCDCPKPEKVEIG